MQVTVPKLGAKQEVATMIVAATKKE